MSSGGSTSGGKPRIISSSAQQSQCNGLVRRLRAAGHSRWSSGGLGQREAEPRRRSRLKLRPRCRSGRSRVRYVSGRTRVWTSACTDMTCNAHRTPAWAQTRLGLPHLSLSVLRRRLGRGSPQSHALPVAPRALPARLGGGRRVPCERHEVGHVDGGAEGVGDGPRARGGVAGAALRGRLDAALPLHDLRPGLGGPRWPLLLEVDQGGKRPEVQSGGCRESPADLGAPASHSGDHRCCPCQEAGLEGPTVRRG